MGHQESDVRPLLASVERSIAKTEPGSKSGVPLTRESVPIHCPRRTFGVPLEQLVILGHSGVPRIVARLCHYVERHGMQTEGLFRTPGSQRAVVKMRADFDMYGDSNLERYKDVAAAAGCLKMFLRELPESVVPCRYTKNFVASLQEDCGLTSRCNKLSALVHGLPPPHYALLRFLCSFLRRVSTFHSAAHMSPETLGVVFGPNIFRSPPAYGSGAPCLQQQAATNQLLAQLIHNYDRIFNAVGQRQRPGSIDRGGSRDRGDLGDNSASTGGVKQRVDKSLHAAVSSHLHSSAPTQADGDVIVDIDGSEEPPCKRLEAERAGKAGGSFEGLAGRHARASYQPWPAGQHQSDCVRRTNSHDNVRDCTAAGAAPGHLTVRDCAGQRSRSPVTRSRSAHQVAAETTEPISVPSSQGYDLPTPWSPVYTDEVIESPPSSSSSSSECGDDSPAEIMCRHELQRESERFAAFPRASRDKTSRSRDRDSRRRRHSRGDGKDSGRSSAAPEEEEEEFLSDSEAIPPLDLVLAGSEPIPSAVLKGRQLTEDEAILSPRNSFILPDADFIAEQAKLCSRFNERPPTSPSTEGGEPRTQQLRQTIASAKRRIRSYEESFESRYGYRPSHADRQKDREVKRCLSELSRARRDLKQLKVETAVSRGIPSSLPTAVTLLEKENRTPEEEEIEEEQEVGSLERTVADVTKRLSEKRHCAGRPAEPDAMSRDQVLAEKVALQKALLCLEQRHGRPAERHDRDLVRPLYERYRQMKRLVVKSGSPKLRDSIGELTPILEHETMSFTAADRPAISEREDEFESSEKAGGVSERLQLDDNLHNLPVSQLRDQLNKAKDEKRSMRNELIVFEENFRSNVGRKVQKDDRGDMDDTYAEYKQLKAKVKLLEVLVAKHRSRAYTM